ncbi:MAG: glycosyltransferase family 4 protein [Thiotrichales bacterium]
MKLLSPEEITPAPPFEARFRARVLPAPNPRSVLILANTSWYVFNFRGNLIRRLVDLGHSVSVSAPPDDYSRRIPHLGAEYHALPLRNSSLNPLQELRALASIRKVVTRVRPDCTFTFTPKPNLYTPLACIGRPTRVVPNVSGLGSSFLGGGMLRHATQSLYRVAFALTDKVFFQNRDDSGYFVTTGLVNAGKVDHLPGSGVDLARFPFLPLPRHRDGQFTFLMAARLLRDKGVIEYCAAYETLRRSHPGVRCVLVGPMGVDNPSALGPDELSRWIDAGIEYHAMTDDIRPFIESADCVVLPSYREGTPRILLEAAAMGRPIVTTDTVGCRNVVSHGLNGLLCKARDAADLATAMARMMALEHAERAVMGRLGRIKVEAEFDENIVITKYLELVAGG